MLPLSFLLFSLLTFLLKQYLESRSRTSTDEMCSFVRVRQQCTACGFDRLDTSKQTQAILQGWLWRRPVYVCVRESWREGEMVTSNTQVNASCCYLLLPLSVLDAHCQSTQTTCLFFDFPRLRSGFMHLVFGAHSFCSSIFNSRALKSAFNWTGHLPKS